MPTQSSIQERFQRDFQQFWQTDSGLRLLAALRGSTAPDCAAVSGWTKGGCLVAARGIQAYITNSPESVVAYLRVALVVVATDETEAAHVLVRLGRDEAERYLDATGVWTREALLSRLAQEYQYDVYALLPWEAVVHDQVRIPFDGRIAQAVGEALAWSLGPFTPACIFAGPDLLAV